MPIDRSFNNPYGVLLAVAPDIILMDYGEDLDAEHIFDGLLGLFKFIVDGRVKYFSGIYHNCIYPIYLFIATAVNYLQ